MEILSELAYDEIRTLNVSFCNMIFFLNGFETLPRKGGYR